MAPCISRTVLDPKADLIVEKKKEEFSGEIEGGTLWQALKVEENVIKNILLQLDPVDLINLEKIFVLMINLEKTNSTSENIEMRTVVSGGNWCWSCRSA